MTTAKPKITTKATGLILSPTGLIVIGIVLVLAAWNRFTIVVVIAGLAVSTAGLSRLWAYLAMKNLRGERILSDQRVFPGDSIELKLRLVNRKLLPLPWAEISQDIPVGFLKDEPASLSETAGFQKIVRASPMLWYAAMSWKCRLYCRKRGYYKLGELAVTSGDIFGFYPRTLVETAEDYLIVYPRLFEIERFPLPASYPLGETVAEKRLFEDPSRAIGVRDYSPGDSLRRIHWKASARRQQLQVKVFEATTTLKVALFLAVDSYQLQGLNLEDELETGISTAASLANQLIDKKSQVGLWANSKLADSGFPARITAGSGVDRLVQILEALAKTTPVSYQPFQEFFRSERKTLPAGATLIFILCQLTPELKLTLSEARFSSFKILVFQTGGNADSEKLPGIPWYLVNSAGEITEARTGEPDAGY